MMPAKNHAKVLLLMTLLLGFVAAVETFLTPDWKPMVMVEKILLIALVFLNGYQWGRYRGMGKPTPLTVLFKQLRSRFK